MNFSDHLQGEIKDIGEDELRIELVIVYFSFSLCLSDNKDAMFLML